jgi:hypothetical protein
MVKNAHEAGNVLFLILVAVVLFAALSFAMTMSGRGQSSDSVTKENRSIAMSQLLQSSVDLERAMTRLRIAKTITLNRISFETPALAGYVNPACTVSECQIFHPDGGGVSYPPPSKTWLDPANAAQATFGHWIFTGTTCVPGIGLGSDANCNTNPDHFEIIAYVPWITKIMCADINTTLDVPLTNGAPPQISGSAWSAPPEYTGVFNAGEALIDAGNTLFGVSEGCFEGNGTPPAGTYHYFRVIAAR